MAMDSLGHGLVNLVGRGIGHSSASLKLETVAGCPEHSRVTKIVTVTSPLFGELVCSTSGFLDISVE
jgi:hypothetical protein